MNLSSITSVVLVSDVLTEAKMRPWWEVARRICVVVMLVSALLMRPLTLTSTIQCLPTFSNITLTNSEILYVNRVCNENLPWNNIKNIVTYIIVIAFAFVVHVWYSWWLLVPNVIKKFQTVRKVDDSFKRLDQIELESSSKPLGDSERLKEIIKVLQILLPIVSCFFPHQKRLVKWYARRNVGGIFLLLTAVILSVLVMIVSVVQGSGYKCEIDTGINKIEIKDFTCSFDSLIGPLLGMIVYVLSLICQFVITTGVVIYYNYRCPAPQNNECCKVKHRFNDWKFLLHFAAKANDDLSEKTKKLLLDPGEIYHFMKRYIAIAVESQHFDFLNRYRDLVGENMGNAGETAVRKDIMDAVKSRILGKNVTDEDLKQFSKYCKEEGMYESFVLAHYKKFGQNSEKNYDYKDCGCNLPLDISDVSAAQKALYYVLTSRVKTENGEVIFNRLAIKHLLRWIKGISGQNKMPTVTLQPAQVERDGENGGPPVQLENEDSNIVCNDEIEMFELSLILQECGYGNEIGITDGNRNRYNVYRAIRNLGKRKVKYTFTGPGGTRVAVDEKKSFYKKISKFWFNSRMYKEYFHLHKLIYNENICPEMDEFDIHGYCGCDGLDFMLDDTEPGPNGCSLLYYVLENPDVNSEAMKHVMYWINECNSLEHRKVLKRGIDKIELSPIDYLTDRTTHRSYGHKVLSTYKKVAAKMLDFATIEQEDSDLIKIAVDRIRNRPVTDDDLRRLTRQCMDKRFYIILVLAHYKCFGQSSKRNFDYDECGCSSAVKFDGVENNESGQTLFDHVLYDRIWNKNIEIIFNPLAVEHFLYWNRKYLDSQGIQTNPFLPLKDYFNREEPEKLEFCHILSKIEHVDSQKITGKNLQYFNFYRAIRDGEEVTAEMKNLFGDDKSFYKELSQFWLRNKFYREYVELHKLFYSFRNDLNHENIDCGCDEMTFHLTDTEPGSKGRSLLYYVLVNLDPGSEAMKHVLKRGREKQNDSENKKVKVVIRGANSADCSLMDYVNQQQNNATLIQTLEDFGYQVKPAQDGDGNDNIP